MGRDFLAEVYYPYLLKNEKATGFVAVGEGDAVGFIAAAPAGGFYIQLVKANLKSMIKFGIRSLFRHPFLLIYTMMVILVLFSRKSYQPTDSDMELLYIAVAPGSERGGVGSGLTEALFLDLPKIPGFKQCVVKTLESTAHTNRFYERNGFGVLHRAFGRVWYAREINAR